MASNRDDGLKSVPAAGEFCFWIDWYHVANAVFITLLTQVVSSILRDTGYTVTPFAPATPDKRITLQARTQHNSVPASNHVRTRIATTLVNYTGDRVTFAYCISLNCIALLLYCMMTHVCVYILGISWDILGYGSAMVNCRLRLGFKAAQCLQRSLELLGSGPTKAAQVTRAVECGRFFMQIHVHVQQICRCAALPSQSNLGMHIIKHFKAGLKLDSFWHDRSILDLWRRTSPNVVRRSSQARIENVNSRCKHPCLSFYSFCYSSHPKHEVHQVHRVM